MANITRFDPFGDLDEFFKGFFVRPMALEPRAPAQFRMDVKEDENAYTVYAELPGVKKEDINVTIDGNQVQVSAEVRKEREAKSGEKVLRSERYYGKLYRAFTLAQDVDQEKAQAKYADGVLELTLPKKATSAGRKLAVQ